MTNTTSTPSDLLTDYCEKSILRIASCNMTTQQPPQLYGLVLAGGYSLRMGENKALITYHDRPHAMYCFDLLRTYCETVFLSLRPNHDPQFKSYPHIVDDFDDRGPIAGILAAMKQNPDKAWLVLACDFPHINSATIKLLIENRDAKKHATAFTIGESQKPEPLCCIYEPTIYQTLMTAACHDNASPQRALMQSETHLIESNNPRVLINANSPEERDNSRQVLGSMKN